MITKFVCRENYNSIEFKKEEDTVLVTTTHLVRTDLNDPEDTYLDARLSEQDLFNLIGQLLRIQAEIKKEVSHG